MSVTYPSLQFTTFPEQVQTFVTMLNMTIADAPAVTVHPPAMDWHRWSLAQLPYFRPAFYNTDCLSFEKTFQKIQQA